MPAVQSWGNASLSSCLVESLEPRLLLDGLSDLNPSIPADNAIITLAASFASSADRVYTAPQAATAREALRAVVPTSPSSLVYSAFAEFARWHFGAGSEPYIYERFGSELGVVDTSTWKHVSENSASLAWETNLPAYTFVQYGLTSAYGSTTEMTDRTYYQHLHQTTDLQKNQTYHYRFVAIDERGEVYVTPDQTFTTSPIAGAKYISGGNKTARTVITTPGYYILTGDIVSSAGGIEVKADNVTLDLNGYSVTYGQGATTSADMYGIWAWGTHTSIRSYKATNFKCLNGVVTQGVSSLMATNTAYADWNVMRLAGNSHEIAGVVMTYHAPQSWGILNHYPSGSTSFHHNVFTDMGALITDRHGAANRVIGFQYSEDTPNTYSIHNNLVKRARQNGIGTADTMHNNEIYIDSWSTNSFAIQPLSVVGIRGGNHYENKIFATGFNAYGFGWAHEDLNVHDNFVFMHGFDLSHRWPESWGDINLLEAFRVTNYSPGGQVRNNLTYWDNTVVIRGSENCEIRGTGFYSDNSISNLVFRNNYVKTESLDAATQRVACIDTQGYFRKLDSLPVYYNDNVLVSNICNVRFGDSYGKGNYHMFNRCDIIRIGDRSDYHTFAFDGTYWSFGHVLTDCKFYGGAKPDDVYWRATGSQSNYTIAWTLGLSVAPNASITITDKNGAVAFSGSADSSGHLSVPLPEYIVRPIEWLPTDPIDQGRGVKAPNLYSHQKIYYTPYTVRVTTGGVTTTYTTAAKPEVRLEFTAEPSNTASTPSLPAAANLAVLEDREFWADVYVRSNAVLNTWVFGGSLNMSFNPAYGRVVAVEPVGEHWQSGSNGTVNNTTGTITGITRTTGAPIGGDDEWVLFARVKFSGKAPVNEAAAQFGPYNMNASMTPGSFSMPFGSATPTVAAGDGAYIYPVIYDVDDNGQILSGDMAVFSAAYRSTVGQLPEPPYARWADFDGNGKVLGGDLALLSAVYRLSTSQVSFEQMPARYRPPTWVSGWWTRVPAFLPLSEPVSEPVATSAQVVQSPTTLTGSPTPAIILGPGQLKLSRLRAARFVF